MDYEKIDAPVLLFSPGYDTFEFIRDSNLLSITNRLGLKKGIVLGNFIIDSSGRMFQTIGAKKKGNYHPFWKFEFFNPLLYIELEVEEVREMFDLSALKGKILKIINQEKDGWINYGEVKEIKKSIVESRTHRELIEIIGACVHPLPQK